MNTYQKPKFEVNMNDMLKEVLSNSGTISTCYSNFHNYSIRNQFLAYWQMKCRNIEVSPINSFGGWKKLNRSIIKGQKAIWLWMPYSFDKKVIDEVTGEETKKHISGFKFVNHWFALSQTHGETIKLDDIKINNFDIKKVLKTFDIKETKFDHINGNVQGFARVKEKELAINPLAQHCEMTILHEIAHIVCEHDKRDISKDLKELEAETVAYIVGSVLGFDEKQLSDSRGYVQNWFKGNEIPPKNAEKIMSVADKILKAGLK